MFTSHTVTGPALDGFREYIPDKYIDLVDADELTLTLVHGPSGDPEDVVGSAVTNTHGDWLEIIWTETRENYRTDTAIAEFIRYIITQARRVGRHGGVFVQIHEAEATPRTRDILRMAGFEITTRKNNIYSFTLEDVDSSGLKAGKGTFLADADPGMREAIEHVISADKRAVPVELPIPWQNYDPELSVLYTDGPGKGGLLLFSHLDESIVFELAYSSTPTILRTLLGAAYKKATELYDPEQVVIAPIVLTGSEKLIEFLAPNARSGQVLEGILRFTSSDSLPKVRPD